MTKGTIKNRTGIVAHRQWVIAFSGLFRNSPNLLERDLDCRYVSVNEEVSNEFILQTLNRQFGLSLLRHFYEPEYRSSQNKCVNLRLAKSLFPRDCDSQVETLQPYEKIS